MYLQWEINMNFDSDKKQDLDGENGKRYEGPYQQSKKM